MVHVLQEPDIRPIRHARPRHHLPQIVRVGEEARPLEVVPLQEDQNLMRIGGAAKEPPPREPLARRVDSCSSKTALQVP